MRVSVFTRGNGMSSTYCKFKKTRNVKINFVFTNTTRRKISEINYFKIVFNCIKHSKNVVFLCQAIPGRFRKSLKMVFYTWQIKTQKSQKEHILVSRKSLIFGSAKHLKKKTKNVKLVWHRVWILNLCDTLNFKEFNFECHTKFKI